MSTAVKRKLSASPDGDGITISGSQTPGTLMHTAVSGSSSGSFDEIWLYAYNGHTTTVALTVEFGGATVPDQNIVVSLASKSGLQLIVPGLILQNELTVKAFSSVVNVVTLSGFVNRITD